MLTLKGNEPIYIGIGSIYQEPGYSVKTVGGEELSNDLVQITIKGQNTGNTTLDTSIEETYTITYTVEYKGNSSTKTRTVHVGNYNPSIEITPNGTSKYSQAMDVNIKVQAHEQFSMNVFTYTLIKDGVEQTPITVNKTSETITLNQDGIYTIKVEAIDSENNSSTLISEPYKIDVTLPTITMSNVTITSTQALTYNLMTGVTVADNSGITPTVTTSGSLSSAAKTYTITYTVTDEAGNSISKTRNITVKTPLVSDIVKESSNVMTNDPDGNPRYVGSNPNNYVRFNNELWRIIGVFNGQAKIIRNEPFSERLALDTKNINDWSQATLQTTLNGTYFNSIKEESKLLIDDKHIWKIGGIGQYEIEIRSSLYKYGRGTQVYSGSPTTWIGAIGLIYPSDVGYSTSSTDSASDTRNMNHWDVADCGSNLWIQTNSRQWTMTPFSNKGNDNIAAERNGHIQGSGNAINENEICPVLFLKSTVRITGGAGTSSNPYILSGS